MQTRVAGKTDEATPARRDLLAGNHQRLFEAPRQRLQNRAIGQVGHGFRHRFPGGASAPHERIPRAARQTSRLRPQGVQIQPCRWRRIVFRRGSSIVLPLRQQRSRSTPHRLAARHARRGRACRQCGGWRIGAPCLRARTDDCGAQRRRDGRFVTRRRNANGYQQDQGMQQQGDAKTEAEKRCGPQCGRRRQAVGRGHRLSRRSVRLATCHRQPAGIRATRPAGIADDGRWPPASKSARP